MILAPVLLYFGTSAATATIVGSIAEAGMFIAAFIG